MLKRYSIRRQDSLRSIEAIHLQVAGLGGSNIVVAAESHMVFATLDDAMVIKLTNSGLVVRLVSTVKPAVVTTPTDLPGNSTYTPGDLLDLLKLNNYKFSVTPPLQGTGLYIAVIDTGIRATHHLIGGSVVYSHNFSGDVNGDVYDHGTGVASVLHGVVPGAGILDMKSLDSVGNGTDENVVMAIEGCIDLLSSNPAIAPIMINMSIGSPDNNDEQDAIRLACRAAMARGIIIVAACGNSGPQASSITVPACEKYVVAVGSVKDSPFGISAFSSRGPTPAGLIKPDTCFLGEDIIIASSKGDTTVMAKSGTSYACPMTAGVLLMEVENTIRIQKLTPAKYLGTGAFMGSEVINALLPQICTKPTGIAAGKDNNYGYGAPVGSLMGGVGTINMQATLAATIAIMMIQAMQTVFADMEDYTPKKIMKVKVK